MFLASFKGQPLSWASKFQRSESLLQPWLLQIKSFQGETFPWAPLQDLSMTLVTRHTASLFIPMHFLDFHEHLSMLPAFSTDGCMLLSSLPFFHIHVPSSQPQ